MVRQLTLNQTVQLIKELGQSHEQIDSVYFGDLWEFLNTDNIYPALFYSLTGTQIQGKILTHSFSLFFFDREIQDEKNETDVLSDRLIVAQDILSMMKNPTFDWEIEDNVNIEYYTETEVDFLSGVKMDVSISFPYLSDRCTLPEDFNYLEWLAE